MVLPSMPCPRDGSAPIWGEPRRLVPWKRVPIRPSGWQPSRRKSLPESFSGIGRRFHGKQNGRLALFGRALGNTSNLEDEMRYKLLGNSGLRVSELCLGTMTFGEDWGWGGSAEESRKMFDTFGAAGGNFLDTANMYTNGSSEK